MLEMRILLNQKYPSTALESYRQLFGCFRACRECLRSVRVLLLLLTQTGRHNWRKDGRTDVAATNDDEVLRDLGCGKGPHYGTKQDNNDETVV